MTALASGTLTTIPEKGDHIVYRLYGARDELLYVGVTDHLFRRLGQHLAGEMRHLVQRIEWTEFATRFEAQTAEAQQIHRLSPSHNVVGNSVATAT